MHQRHNCHSYNNKQCHNVNNNHHNIPHHNRGTQAGCYRGMSSGNSSSIDQIINNASCDSNIQKIINRNIQNLMMAGGGNFKKFRRTLPTHDLSCRPWACSMCSYKAKNQQNLKIHERIHTGEKPFVCPECGLGFSQSQSLRHHSRIHNDEKPHKCPFCDYTCRVNANLSIHVRKHTGERPFPCHYCDASFAQRSALRTHLHHQHGECPGPGCHPPAVEKQRTKQYKASRGSGQQSGSDRHGQGNSDIMGSTIRRLAESVVNAANSQPHQSGGGGSNSGMIPGGNNGIGSSSHFNNSSNNVQEHMFRFIPAVTAATIVDSRGLAINAANNVAGTAAGMLVNAGFFGGEFNHLAAIGSLRN